MEYKFLDEKTYRSHPALANSDLSIIKALLEGKELPYYKTAFRVGTGVHSALLEKEKWYATEQYRHPSNEVRQIERIRKKVLSFDKIRNLINHPDAQKEVCLFWTDEETGLECKARADIWIPNMILADLKTTSQPNRERFLETCLMYHYDRQLSFYNYAVKAPKVGIVGIRKSRQGFVYYEEWDANDPFLQNGEHKWKTLLRAAKKDKKLIEAVQEKKK